MKKPIPWYEWMNTSNVARIMWKSKGIAYIKAWTVLISIQYNLLTPYSRVLEKRTGSQLAKKFPTFYGNQRFITTFTSARHLSLSSATSVQYMPLPPPNFLKINLNIILPSMPGLPSGLFLSGVPTKTLYAPLLSPIRATCLTHFILLDLITRIFGDKYRSLRSTPLLPNPS